MTRDAACAWASTLGSGTPRSPTSAAVTTSIPPLLTPAATALGMCSSNWYRILPMLQQLELLLQWARPLLSSHLFDVGLVLSHFRLDFIPVVPVVCKRGVNVCM